MKYILELEKNQDEKFSDLDKEDALKFVEWLDSMDFDLIIKDFKNDAKVTSQSLIAEIIGAIALIMTFIATLMFLLYLYPEEVARIKRAIAYWYARKRELEDILNGFG